MPTPSRNAIYDATIRRMTACALEEAENRFAVEHAMTIFCVVSLKLQPNSCFRGRAGRSDCPAEQENGVRVPTLPAL